MDEASAGPVPVEGVLVRGEGLCLAFGARQILDHVDIEIGAGEIVTLVGLNGCGKTTLVRVLLGLTAVDSGTVWRRPGLHIGYTPQRLPVDRTLPMPVSRFLRLGGDHDQAKLEAALDEVGAPGVLRTQMSDLSGGEMNRVVLARALLRDPDLLVLDEPLSGVDIAGQADLYALIERIRTRRGCGILLISHDLHLVMAATDTVVCLNNHVCCSGQPRTVVHNPEFIALFGRRMAESLAIYHHDHDHAHDPTGRVIAEPGHHHDHDH